MYYSRRTRKRHLSLALIFFLIVIYLYTRYPSTPPLLTEYDRLAWRMNANAPSPRLTKSTFNWSSLKPFYPPPKPLAKLPKGPPSLPRIQHAFPPEDPSDPIIDSRLKTRDSRRAKVKAVLTKCWFSYRTHAWKSDALAPISAKGRDQFSGWAATLVDSLDTLWIAGLRDEFDEAVRAVAEIDFGVSSAPRVNVFETNIRYLGGLLSAYDLSRRPVLLAKAVELGDLLYAAFDTVDRMPVDQLDFSRAKLGNGLLAEARVVSASPGTLSLEMTRLSQLTGDPKYFDAVTRVMKLFHAGQNATRLPGVWPTYVSMSRLDVTSGRTFTLAGDADSLYEYLPKMHLLLGGRDPMYETMARGFMQTSTHFYFRPMLPSKDAHEDILISGNVNVDNAGNVTLYPESEHLVCFTGGAMALAGKLLASEEAVVTGGRLARGCSYVYRSFPHGVGPERWSMAACPSSSSTSSCPWDEGVWEREKALQRDWRESLPLGFTAARDPRYLMRPEAVESLFVLYRVTGEERYVEMAWEMFEALAKATETPFANAEILDVTAEGELTLVDSMESFWLAETLKYFYLIFSPPDLISLDDFVLNTEAHPFRIPK